jgi:hypothetical protein
VGADRWAPPGVAAITAHARMRGGRRGSVAGTPSWAAGRESRPERKGAGHPRVARWGGRLGWAEEGAARWTARRKRG